MSVVFTGLACGTLLTTTGLILWGGPHKTPPLSQALDALRWLSGGLLLIGAVFAWRAGDTLFPLPMRLTLIAALVAPPDIHRHPRSPWSSLPFVLTALILTGVSLAWTALQAPGTAGFEEYGGGGLASAGLRLATTICGGLGARASSEALSGVAGPFSPAAWPFTATYTALTLLTAGVVLVNTWQWGTMWMGPTEEGGLIGAWLAWSAARFGPHRPAWLRATLIVIAALVLIAGPAAGY